MALFDPFFPGILRKSHCEARGLAKPSDERQSQQQRILHEPIQPAGRRCLRMSEPELVEALGLAIDQRINAELLNEPLEFSLGGRTFEQVHEVRPNPALGEKPERLPRFGTFLHAEDLNFHVSVGLGGRDQ